MKKTIITLIIGLVAGTTLTAGAAYVYTARDIEYQPSDNNWNVENVSDALNGIRINLNDINELTSKGFMIYPSGSINLIANNDNSLYQDNEGYYVIADTETGRNMINTNNYKSIVSNIDTKGKVGSDLVNQYKVIHTNTYTLTLSEITKDLGEEHNYRYVDATNVYNKGVEDGKAVPALTSKTKSFTITKASWSVTFDFPNKVVGVTTISYNRTKGAVQLSSVSGNTVSGGYGGDDVSVSITAVGY